MNYSQNLFFGASPEIHRRARELRKNLTPAERKLWDFLRSKNLGGYKFRRQHPISYYIADFYCHSLRLVIELDGGVHDTLEQKEHDVGRELELRNLGLHIIRFRNEEVNSLIHVGDVLKAFISNPKNLTPP
jgi:very-short-patch-repair endonuclease